MGGCFNGTLARGGERCLVFGSANLRRLLGSRLYESFFVGW